MAKANPTRPDAPPDERSLDAGNDLPARGGPPLRDPRSVSAMDNIGLEDQADLLDPALDDEIGDRSQGKRIFSDDVRSDEIGGVPDKDS